jgi:carboxypeptidase Taq
MDPAWQELRDRLGEVSDLGRARALLAWDERTQMPAGGATARADQLATLARIRHQRLSSGELGRLLEQLAEPAGELDPDSDDASLVRIATREWSKAQRVPAELRAELTRTTSLAERAWMEARERSDFGHFLPHLERVVELRRRYVDCFAPYEHPYDPLLDDYEPGMTTADLRPVLEALRQGLGPLVEGIAASRVELDDSCLHGSFPLAAQAELSRRLVELLPLEPGAWRLDTTTHPFATAIAPSDIRLTTRYDETYVGSAIWAVIHEAGHGIYENGMPHELRRTPAGHPASLGFHESQSRLWENWVGRSRPFMGPLLDLLREAFAGRFGEIDADALYRAANVVRPSLIRVEADEVTYNLHIAMRFELELEIFEGALSPAELPEAWNERMREYLGLEVPDDAHGVLQDVHWAAGSFGYFPTYSLGNVIAAQLWEAAAQAVGDLEPLVERGELQPLRDFLDERLYRHAGKFESKEMVRRVVEAGLDVAPLLRHLQGKYGDLYELA